MRFKIDILSRKFFVALALSLIAIPFARYVSPKTVVDGAAVYLAWLPLSASFAITLLFGRHAILPLIISFMVVNSVVVELTSFQASVLLFCQMLGVTVSCSMLRWIIGKRWRYGLPKFHMGMVVFWIGFIAPALIKGAMYLMGCYLHFPLNVANYFSTSSLVYGVVDVQSLICASLIFTPLFYYPLRMLLNYRYAIGFWHRHVTTILTSGNRTFVLYWLLGLVTILSVLCSPYENKYIAGYLVPIIFILFFAGISRLSSVLIVLIWSVSAFLLVLNNKHFLFGVLSAYSVAFVLSVLISFTICILYMVQIYARGEALKRKWHDQALIDPLTGLPNLREFELYLKEHQQATVCCLRIDNLEFLSRHYGMMMRIYCKRAITRNLQPLLTSDEKLFQIPGNELLLVLTGPETEARLTHIVEFLNNHKINWNNHVMDLEFGASWGVIDGKEENQLHHTLGQLSWLSEQACSSHQVLALDSREEAISGFTTERVMMLNRVKRALAHGGILLYAQPIVDKEGKGYHEILSRLQCDGELIMPDKFIPIITQFNLSYRFDMRVVETLFSKMKHYPGQRFSLNLMPFTLMQKGAADEIIALLKRYHVAAQKITIEVTEEQAFSDSENSLHNIRQLSDYGFLIAIDDFGTGYANYERLKRLEADIVKIDGCFVRDIVAEKMDQLIVKSICDMAKVKNLTLVAEYVETEEQKSMLFALGVDYLQGYLIGKPAPLSELKK
ncbi:sensor domain-containing phosphodiesterase [Pseudocitrobacter cyperus]|uniref:EAL domain-containing protein n=1 Tax=Pseudocitrobacter cyperus TaxID=3112843 RepID=A0ABV0HNF8_9ENTR